jgi:ATP-binding protein involved in chromosome partitioning
MSAFVTPSGERFAIFGQGGGRELAEELEVPLLGSVPLTMPLREHADGGEPLVLAQPDDPASVAIHQVARGLIAMTPLQLPTLPVMQVGNGAAPSTATVPQERKPAGMSLPMA